MRCAQLDLASTRLIRLEPLRLFANSIHSQMDVLSKDLDAIDDVFGTVATYSKSFAEDTVPPDQAERIF